MGSHQDFTCLFYTNTLKQSIYIVEINHNKKIKKLEQVARKRYLRNLIKNIYKLLQKLKLRCIHKHNNFCYNFKEIHKKKKKKKRRRKYYINIGNLEKKWTLLLIVGLIKFCCGLSLFLRGEAASNIFLPHKQKIL